MQLLVFIRVLRADALADVPVASADISTNASTEPCVATTLFGESVPCKKIPKSGDASDDIFLRTPLLVQKDFASADFDAVPDGVALSQAGAALNGLVHEEVGNLDAELCASHYPHSTCAGWIVVALSSTGNGDPLKTTAITTVSSLQTAWNNQGCNDTQSCTITLQMPTWMVLWRSLNPDFNSADPDSYDKLRSIPLYVSHGNVEEKYFFPELLSIV